MTATGKRAVQRAIGAKAGETSAEWGALLTDLTHTRSCPSLTPLHEEDCTCGLVWRKRLRTEMEMHNAWRKRAEQAESELAAGRVAAPELSEEQREHFIIATAQDLWNMDGTTPPRDVIQNLLRVNLDALLRSGRLKPGPYKPCKEHNQAPPCDYEDVAAPAGHAEPREVTPLMIADIMGLDGSMKAQQAVMEGKFQNIYQAHAAALNALLRASQAGSKVEEVE